jgi:hypothetical protein
MATLKKMTRMGADVRQIARLLQAKAPENHMLAYITPEEAQLLKDRGGSGKPHADTGIPSFQEEQYGFTENTAYDIGPAPTEQFVPPQETSSYYPQAQSAPVAAPAPSVAAPVSGSVAPQINYNMGEGAGYYGVQPTGKTFAQPYSEGQGFQAGASRLAEMPTLPSFIRTPAPPTQEAVTPTGEESIMQRLQKATGMKEEALARLGIGGIQAILGARTARKAAEQGRQGKAETQAIAEPYRAKGAELQRAAQAGELTPQSQQALQAVQAQTAQQATARGGVGTMQAQAQVEAFRQQLLASQYDYGLKLSGIGDQIALGAIKTGLQADQYVQSLTNNYYTNIARALYGTPPQVAQQTTTPGAP